MGLKKTLLGIVASCLISASAIAAEPFMEKVPKKVEFWNLCKQWYLNQGMSEQEFEEIKQQKVQYRQKPECQDWPELVSRTVDVTTDTKEWNQLPLIDPESTKGCYVDGKIYFNPDKELTPDDIEQILIHEALHPIQEDPNKENVHLKCGFASDPRMHAIRVEKNLTAQVQKAGVIIAYFKQEIEAKEKIEQKRKQYIDECDNLVNQIFLITDNYFENLPPENQSNLEDKYDELYSHMCQLIRFNRKYLPTISKLKSTFAISKTDTKKIDDITQKILTLYDKFENPGNEPLPDAFVPSQMEVLAETYTSDMIELDPRLFEMNRLWYETNKQTVNPSNAEKAFDFFINSNVPDKYQLTQKEMKGCIKYWKNQGTWKNVKPELLERMAGLP